jgi:hypothetical protein
VAPSSWSAGEATDPTLETGLPAHKRVVDLQGRWSDTDRTRLLDTCTEAVRDRIDAVGKA